MAQIVLPVLPTASEVDPKLMRAGGDLGGNSGGSVQRILRLGGKYAVDVKLPPTLDASMAADWVAAALQSDTTGDTLVLQFPQPALATALGAPLVDGAGQAGTTIAIKGLTPGVTVPKNRFFSGQIGGRYYLYSTTAAVLADGTGRATVPVAPKIRAGGFADGAALDFATAKIEGLLQGSEWAWTVTRLTWLGMNFTLCETK